MERRTWLVAAGLAGATVVGSLSLAQEPDVAPRFETDVDVVAVDANVVDRDGHPVRGLVAADFHVEVDGRRRRVLSADFIEMAGPLPSADPAAPPPPAPRVAMAPPQREGRRVVIVIDRGELGIGAVRTATRAASRLLDQLGPQDRVALLSLPSGPRADFTTDRSVIEKALDRMGPAQDTMLREFRFSLSEAAVVVERRPGKAGIVQRECEPFLRMVAYVPTAPANCERRVENEARVLIEDHQRSVVDRVRALEALTQALGTIPGAKTMVLISGGLGSDTFGTGSSISTLMKSVAASAAAARVNVYSLYFSQRAREFEAAQSAPSYTPSEDRQMKLGGLERLTGMSGGALFEVVAGADRAFQRVASEISGHYLLGLEPGKDDRDGKPHDIEVKVARKGVEVRARRQFVMDPSSLPRRVRQALPPAPPSPVRMTSHVMRGAVEGQIRVVLAAEVDGFSDGRLVVQVVNPTGGVIGSLENALQTVEGAPPRWQETLLLDRGPYLLKAAAVDAAGKRVTAERPLNAELLHGVGFDSSDLMLFERVGETSRLVVDGAVRGRVMPVYLELYVEEMLPADRLGVTIEIAGADGARRGSAPLTLRPSEAPGVFHAEGQVDVWALPPGRYVARVLVTFGTKVARSIERHFEVLR